MKRGDVYQTALDPTTGSEQAGTRPAIIVSRDNINSNSPVLIVVPITSRLNKKHLYASGVEIRRGKAAWPQIPSRFANKFGQLRRRGCNDH